jgi:hypothetical protein
MPTVRSDIVIRLGSSESDARSDRRAIDDATPFVAWSLPSDIQQVRFSVRLASAEPNGWAFTTSGVRNTPDQQFDFPSGIGLNDNFSGLCKLEVSVSSSASGDMQWVSEPYWFVYDRHLERFFQADQLRFEWSATDDPDGLPVNGIHHYWLQIAHDPLFNDVVYDNTAIVEPVATRVRYTATAFVPAMGRHYFYRVAMHDGLEWGEWSIVHAFVNLERQPPSVTIDSVTHTGNLLGDIDITLTVSGADDHYVWVELMYRIGGGEKHPPSLLDSLLYLPDGTHRVTWRSFRNLQRQHVDGVMLHAIPYDESSAGGEVAYGPFAIDNSYIPIEGGGFGSATVGFAVRAGHVGVRTLGDLEGERDLPVTGNMVAVPDPATYGQIEAAVRGGKLARFLGFVMGTAEKRPGSGQTLPGINPPTAAPDGGLEAMPTLMRYPLGDVPMSGGEPAMEIIETERANPHADTTAFMFSSPVHYANNEDAWPRPMQTRDMGKTSFLWGYLDPAGNEVPYPDGYDFDHRPSWHVGREVWRHDDAWVQVGAFLPVDAGACGVCSGRNWVPAGPSGNYRRDPCPNADCVNGFDMSNPLWLEPAMVDGQAVGPSGSYFAYYLDVQWHHLSTWVNNTGGFGRLDRNGPGASIRIPAYEMRDADESFWPAAGHTGKAHQQPFRLRFRPTPEITPGNRGQLQDAHGSNRRDGQKQRPVDMQDLRQTGRDRADLIFEIGHPHGVRPVSGRRLRAASPRAGASSDARPRQSPSPIADRPTAAARRRAGRAPWRRGRLARLRPIRHPRVPPPRHRRPEARLRVHSPRTARDRAGSTATGRSGSPPARVRRL